MLFREFIAAWAKLLANVWHLYRFKIVLLMALTVFAGIADGIGMAMLLPLLSFVGVGAPASGTVTVAIDQAFLLLGLSLNLEAALGAILLLVVLQGIFVVIQGHMIAAVEAAYVSHWRETLLERLLGASWPYFATSRIGSLVFLIVTEAERLGRAFFLTIHLIAVLIVAAAYIALSMTISWSITLILILSLSLVAALLLYFSSRPSFSIGRDYGTHLDELQALITEFISGAKLIKATAAEPFVLEKLRPVHVEIERNYFGGVVIPYVLKAVLELVAIVVFCLLIYLGVKHLDVDPAALLVLLAMFFRLVPKLNNVQYNIQLLLAYLPSFLRLEAALDDIDRMSEPYRVDSRERGFTKCPAIAFKDVTVTYGARNVLDSISLVISANTTVGIIGSSGAGKSTLVDCMVGLAVPKSGSISFDQIPIADVNLRQWRSSIGYVAQETMLFDGTIREIICQGRAISEDHMFAAACQAHADFFILELPSGYDTFVGARGVQLSGGQKQRLSLARALAGLPVMLILDEPTSALDSLSEKEIVSAIQELHGKITILVVSHRISTIRHADKIVVLDKGRILSEGGWESLSKNRNASRFWTESGAEK